MVFNPRQLILDVKDSLMLYGSVSMGVFLFILFFQPFPSRFNDFNDLLIFSAGFGIIVLLLLYIIHLFFVVPGQQNQEALSYFNGFILLVLSSAAFTFYLRYVGKASITFNLVAKIVLICLAPPAALRLFNVIHALKLDNDILLKENFSLFKQLHNGVDDKISGTIELPSAINPGEFLKLPLSCILLIRSADNYVEIFYQDDNAIRKKMIRNTLRNIELILQHYRWFLRSHRTCIINTSHIEKLHFKINSSYIILKGLSEPVPVSRQYILKLKEFMAERQG
jgi:DNA-binding LytR/AlgR family response regulator